MQKNIQKKCYAFSQKNRYILQKIGKDGSSPTCAVKLVNKPKHLGTCLVLMQKHTKTQRRLLKFACMFFFVAYNIMRKIWLYTSNMIFISGIQTYSIFYIQYFVYGMDTFENHLEFANLYMNIQARR